MARRRAVPQSVTSEMDSLEVVRFYCVAVKNQARIVVQQGLNLNQVAFEMPECPEQVEHKPGVVVSIASVTERNHTPRFSSAATVSIR